jgi:DNA-binding MarR family transcriptional regulator
MNEKLPTMSKLGVIFLTWRRYLQRDLISHKITLKQLHVLRQLERRAFLYPSQIADMLFCDRPTATVVIKNMERDGWVAKEKDPVNSKQIKVFLTPEGRQKLASLENRAKPPEREIDPLDCFSDDEKQLFDQLLNKLGRHMEVLK